MLEFKTNPTGLVFCFQFFIFFEANLFFQSKAFILVLIIISMAVENLAPQSPLPLLSSDYLVNLSIWVIVFCMVVSIVLIGIIFLHSRRTAVHRKTKEVLASLNAIKKGRKGSFLFSEKEALNLGVHEKKLENNGVELSGGKKLRVGVVESESEKIYRKGETSLKGLLIKKFKPKIEAQLGTKIDIVDFSVKGNEFFALTEISGVRVVLSLDSSGKIFDYKKVTKETDKSVFKNP